MSWATNRMTIAIRTSKNNTQDPLKAMCSEI